MKRTKIAIFIAFALALTVACSSGTKTYLTLILPLQLSTQLDNVSDNLGTGTFEVPIKFNMQAASGIFDMVDGFFTFLNAANMPDDTTQDYVTTDQGQLAYDFSSIGTVTADLNFDGQAETIECSRSMTLPICARFWIDSTPLGLLVLVESATGGGFGQGTLTFVPALVDLAETGTEVSATWNSGTAEDDVRAYYVGQAATDVVSTKAAVILQRDRSADAASFTMKQSGTWSSNPIANCTESQAVFGWVDEAAFISTSFKATANCTLPSGTNQCVNISTSELAASADDCTVNINVEQYIDLDSFDATNAALPADFPATPPF